MLVVKLALAALAGTVTLAGTCAAGLLLVSDTTTPPAGAGPLRVTVPVAEFPPTRLVGTNLIEDRVGADVTVRDTVTSA